MKNVNNFQIAKVQPQGLRTICLIFFCQFEPGVAYKGVAYTKKRVQYTTDNFLSPIFSAYLQGLRINGESLELINISSLLLHLLFRDFLFVFHQNSVFIIFISFFV